MWRRAVPVFVLACVSACSSSVFAQQEREAVIFGDEKTVRVLKEHLEKAHQHIQQNKYDEAVKELVWCLDKGKQAYPEFENCVTCEAVRALHAISKVSPTAGKTIKKRREAIEKDFREGKGTLAKGLELYTINQKLADWTRTQELYNELGEKGGKSDKKMQRVLFRFIEESLLEDGEYETLLKGAGDGPGSLESRQQELDALLKKYAETDPRLLDQGKLHLCRSAARYYQALLALGKMDEATAQADEFLQYHPKGPAYVIFMRAAVTAEKFAMARKLAKQAEKSLPEEEYAEFVEKEAESLPQGKKDKDTGKSDDGKKQDGKGKKSKKSKD